MIPQQWYPYEQSHHAITDQNWVPMVSVIEGFHCTPISSNAVRIMMQNTDYILTPIHLLIQSICSSSFIFYRNSQKSWENWACAAMTSSLASVVALPWYERSIANEFLSQALCNLSSAFLADFTFWFYCSHTFLSFLSQNTLCFSFGSKNMIPAFTCLPSYRYISFALRAYLCCGIHIANGK